MTFVRNPVTVEAEQFVVGKMPYPKDVCFCVSGRGCAHLHTKFGTGLRMIRSGDWIIRGQRGSLFSSSDERFKAEYEEAKT